MTDFIPRKYYGTRLEPESTVLHGAGQSIEAFSNYADALPGELQPALYMIYAGLRDLAPGTLLAPFGKYAETFGEHLIPQLGLGMTCDGEPEQHYEHDVAAGRHDAEIEALCADLKAYGRPVFLRLGFEFNGHWNGYDADAFVAAWKRVCDALDAADVTNVARVWCYSPDDTARPWHLYYPGHDDVDWWSIDLFAPTHMEQPETMQFLDEAEQHGKPVMIGESTPRRVGTQNGQASWEGWFAGYFGLIRSRPGIKAFCYINWDWSGYPAWSDWGDGRIEANAELLKLYREELSCPLYQHQTREPV